MEIKENLYIKDYVDYYLIHEFLHIFIYDDNTKGGENLSDALNNSYNREVIIYAYKKVKK